MNRSKANSEGNVPFSWEKKPGVSKSIIGEELDHNNQSEGEEFVLKLRPPPCPVESPRVSAHHNMINIPLPPCTFQPPSRSSSNKGHWNYKQDDPFLAAYKECTKNTARKGSITAAARAGFRKSYLFKFSCKNSCSVRTCDDNLVRVSQVPYEIDKEKGEKWHQLSTS